MPFMTQSTDPTDSYPALPSPEEEGAEEQSAEEARAAQEPTEAPPTDGRALWQPTPQERAALLRDGKLLALLRKVFRGRVPDEGTMEELLQDTLFAVSRARWLPADPEERFTYIAAMGRNQLVEHYRRASRMPKLADGVEVDEIEHVAHAAPDDPMAAKEFVEKVAEKVLHEAPTDRQQTFRCYLRHHVLREPIAQLAREHQLKPDTLRKRLDKLQEDVLAIARRMCVFLLLLGAVGGLGKIVMRPKPMAWDTPQGVTLDPSVSTHVVESDPLVGARALRGQAFEACVHDQWNQCLADLDAAQTIDPAGDADPRVQAARQDANEALGSLSVLKPGERPWTPTGVRPYAAWAAR